MVTSLTTVGAGVGMFVSVMVSGVSVGRVVPCMTVV